MNDRVVIEPCRPSVAKRELGLDHRSTFDAGALEQRVNPALIFFYNNSEAGASDVPLNRSLPLFMSYR